MHIMKNNENYEKNYKELQKWQIIEFKSHTMIDEVMHYLIQKTNLNTILDATHATENSWFREY